jgi:glycerol-3-phosphate dehydrogenase (NAD(P)+)
MTSNNIKGLVTLIGPSFATEVFNQEPTIVNTISNNLKLSKQVSKLFNNHNFKCIEITDEVGAELIGALKNVMAIAMGIAYELHTSINTRAAMLAQATKEIYQVIKKFGGKAETLTQFCGIGDIYLTCTDTKSRNFAFGNLIAKYGFEKAKQMNKKTVEGIYASKIAYDIINKYKIDAPVLKEIYNVLFNKINHKNFVKDIIKKIIK